MFSSGKCYRKVTVFHVYPSAGFGSIHKTGNTCFRCPVPDTPKNRNLRTMFPVKITNIHTNVLAF